MRLLRTAVLLLLAVALPSLASAQKTDVVVLENGDQITGEVKLVERGRLRLATDSMGTLEIELEEISRVTASRTFVVEDTVGRLYVGALLGDGDGRVVVRSANGAATAVDLRSILRLQPLGSRFWSRFVGSIDAGASYTKSSGVGQASLSASADYIRPSFEVSSRFDGSITLQEKTPQTSRTQIRLAYTKLLSNRWLVPGIGQFENSTDLGITLRSMLGTGVGRALVARTRHRLLTAGGLAVNREVPLAGEPSTNTEAFIALGHSYVSYNSPTTDLDTQFYLYPSLSEPGRVRFTLDTRVRRELLPRFKVGVSLYDTYDSNPPTADAVTNDVGLSFTAGWTF